MDKKPHLILFNPDQWRGDVMGHMGNPGAATPRLDQLVRQDAVSFSNAYCQNPVCTPSRCSFMSGWYPHVRGHRTMHHMMRPDEPVLLRTLKDQGYFVWWGGKNDLVPGLNGYGDYCDVKYVPEKRPPREANLNLNDAWRGAADGDNYYSFYAGKLEKAAEEAGYYDSDWANVLGAVERIRNPPAGKPLCIYLPLSYPHPPYGVEEPYYSRIDRRSLPPRLPVPPDTRLKPGMSNGIRQLLRMDGWTEERWTELRATYYAMCARVDSQFGMILDALRDAGIYDDTAVFFFSDHGDFTGDYGLVEKTQNTFEDCLVRVPFVVKPPVGTPIRPGVCDALIELIDFPATVEALTGIVPQHTHFGRSLLPLIAGADEGYTHRDAVFCEGGRLLHETHAMERESNQTPDRLYWPSVSLQCGDGPEHTKAIMVRTKRYKYIRRMYEADELYDLAEDPGELHNRIEDATLRDVLLTLKERLLTHYQETCDVVPLRPDVRVN